MTLLADRDNAKSPGCTVDTMDRPLSCGPSDPGSQCDGVQGHLVTCRVDELRPHPSYVRHQIALPASQLSPLVELGDLVFREPLLITRDRTILDGFARWKLARRQGRLTLPCLEYDLSEAEALHWLLLKHRRSNGLNAFIRILLALELEPWLKEQARLNQRAGGQNRGSSKLTEAHRLDVRSEIATVAGASAGNVSKVKHLTLVAQPAILQALREGEVSIHRASVWLKNPEKQTRPIQAVPKSSRYHENGRFTPACASPPRSRCGGTTRHPANRRRVVSDGPRAKDLSPRQRDPGSGRGPAALHGSLANIGKPGRTPAMKRNEHPLKKILELTRNQWDQPTVRVAVRNNFRKVSMCRTPALGGEVFASAAAEKVFYHTCKSKCCPSCGNRGTLLWQREQWAKLPDIPYVGIVLTMPDVFWSVLKPIGICSTICQSWVQLSSSSMRGINIELAYVGSSYSTPSEVVSTTIRTST